MACNFQNCFWERATVGLQDLPKVGLLDLGLGYSNLIPCSPTVSQSF